MGIFHYKTTIFSVLFVYSATHQPTWYVLSLNESTQAGDKTQRTFEGPVFVTHGSWWLTSPFKLSDVHSVGNAKLVFPSEGVNASLSYTIDGNTVQTVIRESRPRGPSMCDTGYSVRDLVADLRDMKARGADESRMLREAPDLVKRLVLMKHNWLRSYMYEPNRATERGLIQLPHPRGARPFALALRRHVAAHGGDAAARPRHVGDRRGPRGPRDPPPLESASTEHSMRNEWAKTGSKQEPS